MVSAWQEPPLAMSVEQSAGVRDGLEVLALGTTETTFVYLVLARDAATVSWQANSALALHDPLRHGQKDSAPP